MTTSRRRTVAALLAVVAVLVVLGGCSRELGAGDPDRGGPGVNTSPAAARTKLTLLLDDPCYTAPDPRGTWPRCGRWAEEATSTARAATTAVPSDAALGDAARAVQAGRDTFASRGCASQGPAVATDPGACIGALLSTRTAVTGLVDALRAVP